MPHTSCSHAPRGFRSHSSWVSVRSARAWISDFIAVPSAAYTAEWRATGSWPRKDSETMRTRKWPPPAAAPPWPAGVFLSFSTAGWLGASARRKVVSIHFTRSMTRVTRGSGLPSCYFWRISGDSILHFLFLPFYRPPFLGRKLVPIDRSSFSTQSGGASPLLALL